MALLTTAEVEALMSSGIDASALSDVIDREEDWLANDPVVGIGQLIGSRADTVWVTPGEDRPILLARPTSSVAVVDNGVTLDAADFNLVGGTRVERLDPWDGPKVVITSTPSDTNAVKRALFDLIRLTLSASPYQSESSEGHSYTRPVDLEAARQRIARSLHPHRGPMSVQLRSGLVSDRVTS